MLRPGTPIRLPEAFISLDARPFSAPALLATAPTVDGLIIALPGDVRTPVDTIIILTPKFLDRETKPSAR